MDQPTELSDGRALATDLTHLARRTGEIAFLKLHPYPVLAVELPPARRSARPSEPFDDAPTDVEEFAAIRRRRQLGGALFEVRKRQPVCADMITLGRADVHDIELDDPSVSPFHAFFRERAGSLYVVDAESHQGTRVDGRLLRPHRPELVIVGAVIEFGAVPMRLLGAAECYRMLRAAGGLVH